MEQFLKRRNTFCRTKPAKVCTEMVGIGYRNSLRKVAFSKRILFNESRQGSCKNDGYNSHTLCTGEDVQTCCDENNTVIIFSSNVVAFLKSLAIVPLEKRQITLKAAAVSFLSFMEVYLTIPVPRSVIADCGVH